MRIRKRALALALTFSMLLGLFNFPAYGADREEVITLSLTYTTDNKGTLRTEDVKSGEEVRVAVNFSGNPISSAAASICSAALLVNYDNTKVTPKSSNSRIASAKPTINMNRAEGTAVYIGWASPNGLTGENEDGDEELLAEGIIATLTFEAKEDIALGALNSVFQLVESITETRNGEEKETKAFLTDGISEGASHGYFQMEFKLEEIRYTVTFDSTGGSAVEAQTVVHGAKAEQPTDPTKEGYTFGGWQLDDGQAYDFTQKVTENLRLRAAWTPDRHTLTLNPGAGGVEGEASVTVDYGTEYTITQTATPNDDTVEFLGWFDAAEGGTQYTSWDGKADLTLYAHYKEKDALTVTYYVSDGEILTTKSVKYGAEAENVAAPEKEGYTFGGWQLDGKAYDFTQKVTENLTLRAAWTPDQHTLTLNPGAGSVNGTASVIRDYGTQYAITQTATPNDDTTEFLGWFDAATGGTQYTTWDAKADLTLYAQYKEKDALTVTYVSDGETFTTKSVQYGAAAEDVAAPTKEGYTFGGWQLNGVAYDFTQKVTENLTLTAAWTQEKHTLTLNPGAGGVVGEASVTVDYGTQYTITQTATPNDDAVEFLGWFDAAEGGTQYTTWDGKTDLTLYAHYKEKDALTVTYVSDGVTFTTKSVKYGAEAEDVTPPTKEGHTFGGWQLDGEAYDFTQEVTENLTLTAAWTQEKHTLTLNPGAGGVVGEASVTVDYGTEYAITQTATPNDDAQEFLGWFDAAEGGKQYTTWDGKADLTLYAQYKEKDALTVTYLSDGKTFATRSVQYGAAAENIAAPAKEGYTFGGWHLNREAYDFTQKVTENLTLIAVWTLDRHTLTLNPGAGSVNGTASVTVDYGIKYPISQTATPSDDAQAFLGWFDAAEGGTQYTIWDGKADLTLYAQYKEKDALTVTYVSDGETVTTKSVKYGAAAENVTPPTKEGYTFDGWQLNGAAYDFTQKVTENLTLTAAWTRDRHTLTLNPGAGGVVGEASVTVDYGTEYAITQTAVPNDDAVEFLGWFDAATGGTQYTTWDGKADLTLYAQYKEKNALTVTYVSDGETFTTKSVNYGAEAENVTLPAKEGYTFGGWQLNGAAYDFTQAVTENLTLTAAWTLDRHTLTLNPGAGGVVGEASVTVDYGTEYTITQTAVPNDDAAEFLGWFDAATGGTQYTTWDGKADLTLYAQYKEKNALTVTYVSDGVTFTTRSVQYGAEAENVAPPTKEGYTFGGWQLNGEAYDFTQAVTENLTLTAAWTQSTYTVTFESGSDSEIEAQTVAYGDSAEEPTAPTKEGYTFGGWQLDGEAYDFTAPVTGDITLTALWQEIFYTVTFDSDGGSKVDPVQVRYHTPVEEPDAPVWDAYAFTGWQLNGEDYDFSAPVTRNITLKATWTKDFCTVTFDSNGGSHVNTQTVPGGETAEIPANPERATYTFGEWRLANGRPYDFSEPVTRDITLKATWLENYYLVSFDTEGAEAIEPQRVREGNSAQEPPAPVLDNAMFAGWLRSGEPYSFSEPVTEEIVLTAKWEENFYTVFFDTGDGSPMEPQKVVQGGTAQIPEAPTQDGFAFVRWTLEEEPYDFETPVTGDLILTAEWTQEYYTVAFDLNGGDGEEIPEQRIPYEGLIAEPPTPVRIGYTFEGWTLNNRPYDLSAPVTRNLMLTARWVSNGNTVLLNLSGHGSIPETYYEENPSVTVTEFAPYSYELNYTEVPTALPLLRDVAEDDLWFTFAGWRELGGDVTSPYLQITEPEKNYEAVWIEGVREGALQVSTSEESHFQGLANPDTGEGDAEVDVMVATGMDLNEVQTPAERLAETLREVACDYGEDQEEVDMVSVQLDLAEPEEDPEDEAQNTLRETVRQNDENTFLGFLSATINLLVRGENKGPMSSHGRVVEIPLSYDLTALPQLMIYRVKQLAGLGAVEGMQRLSARQTSTEDMREGYYVEGEGENAVVYLYTNTENSALYAFAAQQANEGAYTVRFDTMGGSEVAEQHTDGMVERPGNPTRSGYSFSGWYTSRTGGQLFDFTTPVTQDTVVYARWRSRSSGSGSSGGGSSGSSSSVDTYPVTVRNAEHGSVTASRTTAAADTQITVTAKPEAGYKVDAVTVTTETGAVVTVTQGSDGTWTYRQPASGTTVSVTFVTEDTGNNGNTDNSGNSGGDANVNSGDTDNSGGSSSGGNGTSGSSSRFSDVSPDKYYYDAVQWAVEQGVTRGRTDTTFEPDGICTRAQTVTFLWRAAGMPEPASMVNPFTDVVRGSYYEEAVLWALEQGITKGVTETTFEPNATVTRSQVVTFLFRSKKLENWTGRNIFTDVLPGAYYYDAVTWASDKGITEGRTATTFEPRTACTRAQIVTFLYRSSQQNAG